MTENQAEQLFTATVEFRRPGAQQWEVNREKTIGEIGFYFLLCMVEYRYRDDTGRGRPYRLRRPAQLTANQTRS